MAFFCATATATAQPLQDLVSRALDSDPLLGEAEANVASARARKKAALAEHFPRLGVDGSERLSGNIPDMDPELVGRVNAFAGGGIQAQYRGTRHEELFFQQRLAETREDLAYEVTRLYLDALRIDAQLVVARRNLQRHDKIVNDLGTVARYDTGRQYDLIQAQSRKGQVETRILSLESDYDAAQSRLARYSRQSRTDLLPVMLNTHPADEVLLAEHPSYRAQFEEVERADASVGVAKSQRWPRVDVESVLSEDGAARLAFNWDAFNFGTNDNISAARQRKAAASSLLDAVELDINVRRETSMVNYRRSEERLRSAMSLIDSSERVTEAFEKQFQIARRSMVDLLNAYSELSSVESAAVQAESDRQSFALEYLHASARTEAGVRLSASARSSLLDRMADPTTLDLSAGRRGGVVPGDAPPQAMSPLKPPGPNEPADGSSLRLNPECCSPPPVVERDLPVPRQE